MDRVHPGLTLHPRGGHPQPFDRGGTGIVVMTKITLTIVVAGVVVVLTVLSTARSDAAVIGIGRMILISAVAAIVGCRGGGRQFKNGPTGREIQGLLM